MGISNCDVRDYLCYLVEKRNVSASTMNVAINALKCYYGNVLKQSFIYEVKRPKKDRRLLVVLNQEAISSILSVVPNLKHKLMLMRMYFSGLRVSEIVKLRFEDIDFQRKFIHVRGGKGRKDRYTILSDVAAENLHKYLKEYGKSKYLFPSQNREKLLTTRSVEEIFFRGLIISFFGKLTKKWIAGIISVLLFAFYHFIGFGLHVGILFIPIAVIPKVLFLWKKSIISGLIWHMINNFFVFVVLSLLFQ